MSRRTTYTTITSLPEGITRETVLETLHNHTEMIDLNPLVEERHPCKPPRSADAEESIHCTWYSMTDKINYLPGGFASGKVTYFCSFNDLSTGLQTHCYAPLGVDIREKWTLGGSLPGEPKENVELGLGVPKNGLYLREDMDFRCNMLMTKFVKKNLKSAHATLVERLIEKAHLSERIAYNTRLSITKAGCPPCPSTSNNPEYQQAPSYTDSRSFKSMSPFQSPSLPYQPPDPQYVEQAAPPYPYHGVDPAYKEANPYDNTDSLNCGPQQSYNNHPIELARVRTTESFQAVELPVHEVAPLRILKPSPRTSPRLSDPRTSPPIPNRLPGGGRPCQSER